MAVSKVNYGDNTLIDLTSDTVTPDTLLSGVTAHDASGESITGTAELPTKLSQLDGELTTDEQTAVRALIGAGTSNFDGDFNSLKNLPFFSSALNLDWNSAPSSVQVETSEISNIRGTLAYHRVSDEVITTNKVIGGKFSIQYENEITSYDINEVGVEIFYGDRKDSGSFFVTSGYLGYSPFIFCVEKPETMTITTEALGTFTITFPESGIYFLSSMGYVVVNFTTASKKLSNEFISYDTTPTSGSENLITSGAVYTAINKAIGTALGGSY